MAYNNSQSAVTTESYKNVQLNGNICGLMWKSGGDGFTRKYDFSYDVADRFIAANFNQYTGTTFDKTAHVDYSVSQQYDANGNIISMTQNGLLLNSSPAIDNLNYTYPANSNRLQKIDDIANNPSSTLGDLHYTAVKTATTVDYFYDYNGNVISDNNKGISNTVYNFLCSANWRVRVGNCLFQFVGKGHKGNSECHAKIGARYFS